MMDTVENSIRKHYESLHRMQNEQLISLRKENEELRFKIKHDKEQKLKKQKEYEDKIDKLQELANDASLRLNEGSDVIRKLQQHLRICQEKISQTTKELLAKNDMIRDYQSHLNHITEKLLLEKQQLIDQNRIANLHHSSNLSNNHQKINVASQTSPTLSVQRRSVRFHLDKENYSIDPKYFQSTMTLNN